MKNYYKTKSEIEDASLWKTYQQYDEKQLITLLSNQKANERYAAAHELQLHGGEDII